MSELDNFRRAKDEFFARDPHSPLSGQARQSFKGLAYFPPNPDLVIRAPLDVTAQPEDVRMVTSDNDEQIYHRVGVVRFSVDGQPVQLALFSSDDTGRLFIPFRDATSGQETYPAGRYLEAEPPEDGEVVLDFNYAYNPYCAYDSNYSCPLPPVENWLKVPIRAGEKDFPHQVDVGTGYESTGPVM